MVVRLDVVNFEQEMARIRKEVKEIASREISEKIDYATDQLQIVTPVDTGEARSGWKNVKKHNPASNEEGVISNDVEHIVYLNDGHSRQAPRFFIEQVLLTIGILTPN